MQLHSPVVQRGCPAAALRRPAAAGAVPHARRARLLARSELGLHCMPLQL